MSNPAGDTAANQVGTSNAYASKYSAAGDQANSQLFPFLSNELTNPTGFGDDTVNKMKTSGGEAIAGAQGQATEAAQLLGSRTGNTAAAPGIIDAASRNAMKAGADNSRDIDIANEKAKLLQQQAGAGELGSQYGTDVHAVLGALGLANQAANTQNSAYGNSFTGSFMDNFGRDLANTSTSTL